MNVVFIPTILFSFINIDLFSFLGSYFSSQNYEDNKVNRYFLSDQISSVGISHTIEYFLIMSFLLYILKRKKESGISADEKNMIWNFLILIPIFTLFRDYEILTRMKDYFTISYAFVLVYFLDYQTKKNKLLCIALIFLICFIGYIKFLITFDDGGLLPYKSYLFENVSIFE